MISSLSKQLDRLKTQDALSTRVHEKRQATVLFDGKEASRMDIDQIQSIAIEGFHLLCQVMPTMAAHRSIVTENKGIDRMSLTKAENDDLSNKLKATIRAVSKSLLNINSLKVLEYLLRNYQIYAFEADYLITTMLAYHSTPQFSKILQNIDLRSKANRYHNLESFGLTGKPVPRQFMIGMLVSDPSIVDSYRRYAIDAVVDDDKLASTYVSLSSTAIRHPAMSFFATIVSDCLAVSGSHCLQISTAAVKLILAVMQCQTPDDQSIAACLIVSADIICHRLIDQVIFESMLTSLTEKCKDGKHLPSVCKLVILAFQCIEDLKYSAKVATIVNNSLQSCLALSGVCAMPLMLKVINRCMSAEDSDHIAQLLIKQSVHDPYLSDYNRLTSVVADIYRRSMHADRSKTVTKMLKDSYGQAFYDAIASLLDDSLPDSDRKAVESILNDSYLHRLIAISDVSKTSAVNAINHTDITIRRKAISLISDHLISDRHIINKIVDQISIEVDTQALTALINIDVDYSDVDADIIIDKYLTIDEKTIKQAIKLKAVKHKRLKQMIDIADMAAGKLKSMPDADIELFTTVMDKISKHSSTVKTAHLANVLLSNKRFDILMVAVSKLSTGEGVADMFESFARHVNSYLASLNIDQLTSVVNIAALFANIDDKYSFKPSDTDTFVKLSMMLMFTCQYDIDASTMASISTILASLNDIDISDIEDIGTTLTLLLFKCLHVDNLKHGHTIKILMTIRYAIKKDSDVGVSMFKHLLKKLISNRQMFEAGTMTKFDDIDNLRRFANDTKDFSSYVVKVIDTAMDSVDTYADANHFIRFIIDLGYRHQTITDCINRNVSKIDIRSNHRRDLFASMLELYCQSTNDKSPAIEAAADRLRILDGIDFVNIGRHRESASFAALVKSFMQANFKNDDKTASIEIDWKLKHNLCTDIVAKRHERLLESMCKILKIDSNMTAADICHALECLTLISSVVDESRLQLHTNISIVECLDRLMAGIIKHERVMIVKDTSTVAKKFKHGKYEMTSTATGDKLVIKFDDIYKQSIIDSLENKACTVVDSLVELKSAHREAVDDSSLSVSYLMVIVRCVAVSNKQMRSNAERFVRSLLAAIGKSIEKAKKAVKQSSSHKQESVIDIQVNKTKQTAMLSQLHKEVDFIIIKLLSILGNQFSNKKLAICSEVFVHWLILAEKHRSNSLIKLLTKVYAHADSKGKYSVNPMIDPEVHYYSHTIKLIVEDVFGMNNSDVVIGILIAVYIFSSTGSISDVKESSLNFNHFSHFLACHLTTNQSIDSCKYFIDSIASGIDMLSGLLPSVDRKSCKIPKARFIREIMGRSDPTNAESTADRDKARCLRFTMIYLSFVNMAVRDRKTSRYLQSVVMQVDTKSPVVASIDRLLIEALTFGHKLDSCDHAYKNKVAKQSASVISMFDRLRRLVEDISKSVSTIVPIDSMPSAIIDQMSISMPVVIKMVDLLIDRLSNAKLTDKLIDGIRSIVEQSLTSQAIENDRYYQSMMVMIGVIANRSLESGIAIAQGKIESLLAVSDNYNNAIVKSSAISAIALFSKDMNDEFVAVLDNFVIAFTGIASNYIRLKDKLTADGIDRLTMADSKKAVKHAKLASKDKESYGHTDVVRSWIKTLSVVVNNMGSILADSLPSLIVYLAAIFKIEPDMRSTVLQALHGMIDKIDVESTVKCMKHLQQPFAVSVLGIDCIISIISTVSGSIYLFRYHDQIDES